MILIVAFVETRTPLLLLIIDQRFHKHLRLEWKDENEEVFQCNRDTQDTMPWHAEKSQVGQQLHAIHKTFYS